MGIYIQATYEKYMTPNLTWNPKEIVFPISSTQGGKKWDKYNDLDPFWLGLSICKGNEVNHSLLAYARGYFRKGCQPRHLYIFNTPYVVNSI